MQCALAAAFNWSITSQKHLTITTTILRRGGGSGDDSPTSAEVEAAMAEHRQLLATNAALDAELAGLEDRAEASVVHMAQLRRVLTQLEKHKVCSGPTCK